MNALQQAQEWMKAANEDLRKEMAAHPDDPEFFDYDQSLKRAARYACIAQAEATERQAAAMERIAAVLEHTTFQPNDNNSHRVFRTLECPWADTL